MMAKMMALPIVYTSYCKRYVAILTIQLAESFIFTYSCFSFDRPPAMNYALIASRHFSYSYADRVSLTMTVIARNSPLALAVAVTAFPNEPIIALVLVIGPLIELPMLTLVSRLLIGKEKRTP